MEVPQEVNGETLTTVLSRESTRGKEARLTSPGQGPVNQKHQCKTPAERRFWAIMRALERWSRTKTPEDKAELDALIAEAKQDEGGEAEWP